jgi:hypothetical protein
MQSTQALLKLGLPEHINGKLRERAVASSERERPHPHSVPARLDPQGWPNLCLYSVEEMNALTISAFRKSPPN